MSSFDHCKPAILAEFCQSISEGFFVWPATTRLDNDNVIYQARFTNSPASGAVLSSPESSKRTDENPSLSGLSEDITAAIVLLECAENKMFNLLPREEFASPT